MINNIKVVFSIFILFTIFSCKSNLEISNNIYKLQKNSKNYEFIWKETLKKSADKSISYPLWFKVNLPLNIQKFEILDESFIFKYPNKQLVVINESYTLNNIKDKADFNYYLINDFDDLEKYFPEYRKINQIVNSKVNRNRICTVYSNGISKILLFNIKKESILEFKNALSSFKYLNSIDTD